MQDTIYYKGNAYFLDSEPLEEYKNLPSNMFISTSVRRGFTCIWSIVKDRLFLISLGGSRNGVEGTGLEQVFPECSGPLFATWFTGILTLQSGRIVANFDGGPFYEREDVITVKGGSIIGKRSFARDGSPICMLDPGLYQKIEHNDQFHPEIVKKLNGAGVVYVGDLITIDAFTLMKKAKLSVSATEDIAELLTTFGLTLGMHLSGWPPETFDLNERAEQSSKRQQLIEIDSV